MTAKELKQQASTRPFEFAGYVFDDKQLKAFCEALCREQREKCYWIWRENNRADMKILNAPMPEL